MRQKTLRLFPFQSDHTNAHFRHYHHRDAHVGTAALGCPSSEARLSCYQTKGSGNQTIPLPAKQKRFHSTTLTAVAEPNPHQAAGPAGDSAYAAHVQTVFGPTSFAGSNPEARGFAYRWPGESPSFWRAYLPVKPSCPGADSPSASVRIPEQPAPSVADRR